MPKIALTAEFTAKNRQFLRAAHAVRGALNTTLKATAIAAAAGATAYIYAAKRMADYGDQIAKTAKKTGFAADELQRLKYVAELSGSDITGLEAASRRMSSVIEDMRNELSTAKDAFDALGLTLDDVASLPAEKQFLKFLEALSAIKDESRRSALAQDIFGRGGAALLPMISDGIDEFHKLRKEAGKFAPILTQEELRNAERFNDNITRLQYALRKMLWTGLAGGIPEMADALGDLAVKVSEIADSEGFGKIRDRLNGIVKIVTDFATSEEGLRSLEVIAESTAQVLEAAVKTATLLVEKYAQAIQMFEGIGGEIGEHLGRMAEQRELRRMAKVTEKKKGPIADVAKITGQKFQGPTTTYSFNEDGTLKDIHNELKKINKNMPKTYEVQ